VTEAVQDKITQPVSEGPTVHRRRLSVVRSSDFESEYARQQEDQKHQQEEMDRARRNGRVRRQSEMILSRFVTSYQPPTATSGESEATAHAQELVSNQGFVRRGGVHHDDLVTDEIDEDIALYWEDYLLLLDVVVIIYLSVQSIVDFMLQNMFYPFFFSFYHGLLLLMQYLIPLSMMKLLLELITPAYISGLSLVFYYYILKFYDIEANKGIGNENTFKNALLVMIFFPMFCIPFGVYCGRQVVSYQSLGLLTRPLVKYHPDSVASNLATTRLRVSTRSLMKPVEPLVMDNDEIELINHNASENTIERLGLSKSSFDSQSIPALNEVIQKLKTRREHENNLANMINISLPRLDEENEDESDKSSENESSIQTNSSLG
jgi:hypothetical protein